VKKLTTSLEILYETSLEPAFTAAIKESLGVKSTRGGSHSENSSSPETDVDEASRPKGKRIEEETAAREA
jgi:hypothetical protein